MSNIGDDERLVVLLEARIRDFEQNMRKASGTATREYRQMRQDSRTATAQLEADMERSTRGMGQSLAAFTTRAGTLARSFAPIAAGVGVATGALAGFVASARSTAREIATIGDEARRAGISVKAFQELKFVADQNRVSVDALTDGMKELSLRADEFIVTGTGSAAEAFRRLGYRSDELKRKLADPSALFTEIIGKLEHLDRAAQIRIADELFGGTGGEQFVQLIDQGADGIRRMIRQANDLGLVMDEQMIEKAAEIDRQFGLIVATVGTRLKGAIVNASAALRDFFDFWDERESQQDTTLQNRLSDIFEERQALADRLAEMQAQDADPLSIFKNTNEIKIAQARLAELATEATELQAILDTRNGLPGMGQDVVELSEVVVSGTAELDAYGQSLVDLRARLQGNVDSLRLTADTFGQSAGAIAAARFEATAMAEALKAAAAADRDGVDPQLAAFIRERAAEYGALTDRIEASTEAERERQRVLDEGEAQRKRLADFETGIAFERSIMGLPEAEQRIRSTIRGLGVDFESMDGQRIAGAMRYNDALKRNSEGLEQQRDLLSNIASTALDSLFDTTRADSFFDRVTSGFADIGKQLADIGKQRLLERVFGVGYTSGFPAPGQRTVAPIGVPAPQAAPFAPLPQQRPEFVGQAAAAVSGQVLTYAGRFNKAVDSRLMTIMETAASRFPYQVEAISGLRPGDKRFHGRGLAADVQITGPDGKRYGNYQDAGSFRVYERFAQEARRAQQELFPELDKLFRWGGYFSGGRGKYGALDSMHFDLGGAGMGGGTWEGGLTPAQRRLWAGAESVGMGSGGSVSALRTAVRDGSLDATRAVASGQMGLASSSVPIPTARPGSAGPGAPGGALSSLLGGNALGGLLGGVGIFAQGMQSGSVLGGGFSGLMSGQQMGAMLGIGGPAGMVVGGLLGVVGPMHGRRGKRHEPKGEAA